VARLLVVEDDETIGDALHTSLRSHGYEVRWERTGRGALAVGAGPVDLVLLDLGLPDLDGVEVCRRLRALQPAAVMVMLTARTDEMDVVVGLEAGADDYLTKPVRLAELHARIRAHLRRDAATVADDAPAAPIGDLLVDPAARRVTLAGQEVAMRAKEFDLLARLAAEPDRAVSRETLMADVWDENWFGSTKTLDVHVAAVRRKLAEAADGTPDRVPAIVTLRGHGYRLETPAGRDEG
jgi:DNA-binding response OmpR family regulator